MKITFILSIFVVLVSFGTQESLAIPAVIDSNFKVETVVSGLELPTTMAFLGPDDILVLQKNDGKVMRVLSGVLQADPVLDVPVATDKARGLLGITILQSSPDPLVYLFYTESIVDGGSALGNHVYKYTWNSLTGKLENPILVKELPAVRQNHNGGVLVAGLDDTVYAVIGDQHRQGILQNFPTGDPDDTGVILPVNPAGPYKAIGIRNSFGLAVDPITGFLWDTENGQKTFDEINLITDFYNSGWKTIMGPISPDPHLAPLDIVGHGTYIYSEPEFSWLDTTAPTAISFIDTEPFSIYKNFLFVGDNNSGQIYSFPLNVDRTGFDFASFPSLQDLVADNNVERDLLCFGSGFGVITDIKVGPDGVLYVVSLTQGSIFKIIPTDSDNDGNEVEGVCDAFTKDQDNDFNGDRFVDLAIGVPFEDINGKVDAGAVNVIYGSGQGLHRNTGLPDQFWHQDNVGIISDGAEENDRFGTTSSAGDFNNDGYDDLAIGVPFEDIDGKVKAGAVNVIYGSALGLHKDAGLPAQFWHQDSDGIVDEPEENDLFGTTLAAGDFNNDGYDDLAIGVRHENVNGIFKGGAVHVIYGSADGLHASNLPGAQFWHQDIEGIEDQVEKKDKFGNSLESGDFNNDGYDDLAIGVKRENVNGIFKAGAVNVIYGSAQGLHTNTELPNQFWHQDSDGILDEPEENDLFGTTLEAGDFNNDGYDDLAIGVEHENVNGKVKAGAVNVIYGSALGLHKDAGFPDQFWHQDKKGIKDKADTAEEWGYALAAGDFNSDGFNDLAVSSYREDVNGKVDVGAVNVIYGSAKGLHIQASLPDQIWHQDKRGIEDESEDDDRFGTTLAAGDFNHDGYDDLAIGVPGEDLSGVDEGAVNVIYGSLGGLHKTLGHRDQFWHQDSNAIADSAESGDKFGKLQ